MKMQLACIMLVCCVFRVMVCRECGMPSGMHSVGCSRYQNKERVAYGGAYGSRVEYRGSQQYQHTGGGSRR